VNKDETRRGPSVVVTEVETAQQAVSPTSAVNAAGDRLASKFDDVRHDLVDDVRARLILIEAEALARITHGANPDVEDADEEEATMDAQALADVVATLRSKTQA